MAQERPAKRSRKEEPSSSAVPSEAVSGQQDSNPFARLPDALVQQIFSNLDAGKAYEESKLWAVDRRFRQLLPGVLWKSLTLDVDRKTRAGSLDPVQRSESFQKQLQRFTNRLQRRQLLGVQFLAFQSVLPTELLHGLLSNDTEEDCDRRRMEHGRRVTKCMTGLFAAAATAAAPVKSVRFGSDWHWWLSAGRQRELSPLPVLSLKHVASSFLVALSPASLNSINLPCSNFSEVVASVAKPGCVPALRELRAYHQSDSSCDDSEQLSRQSVASVIAAFSELRSLRVKVQDGAALQELAGCAHLEELEVSIKSGDEHAADALAAIAAGPSAAKLRKLHLSAVDTLAPFRPECLASVLRFTSLEALFIPVRPDWANVLPALGCLAQLKNLKLLLDVSGAADGGAGLLRAGAALLGSRAGQGLEECRMRIRANKRTLCYDVAALGELFGAAFYFE
eukprot:tig00000042_g15518.t1